MTQRKHTTQRTSKKKNTSPSFYIAVFLCLAALILVIAIVVLALSSESQPNLPGSSSNSGSSSIPSAPSEPSASKDPSSQESSISIPVITPSDDPSERSDPSEDTSGGLYTQPASTAAYEQQVGTRYAIDMNPFEQYVNPADPMEYVFVVDANHTLAENFEPADLVTIKDMKPGRPSYYSKLRACAEQALQAFLEEGRQYGIDDVGVSNGYRSYASQANLFNNYCSQERAAHPDWTEEQVIAKVLTYSLRPGTSEHQSGLCVDMHNRPNTDLSFAGTKAAIWLEENCYRFGFILRYPEDKQDITTVMFEPWHFRFVGRVAATEMHNLDMCLEEYCAYKGIS